MLNPWNYDIHSLFIIYGNKSTKLHSNMHLRKLTLHENSPHKFRWFHSILESMCIVSRIRYLFIDHTTWPGDPGDPDSWECPATAAPSDLRNPDADSAPDWAHPDLVTQGAVQGLRVPRDQQETGAHRTTQTPLWRPQYLQGHCAVVYILGFSVNHLFCTFI